MRPALRRALTFLAMVSAGLLFVSLFSEEFGRVPGPALHDAEERGDDAVLVALPGEHTETSFTVRDFSFDVATEVETESGELQERPTYRVHIVEGVPGEAGVFVVVKPTITFLEPLTGAVRGVLSADSGRIETGQRGRALDPRRLGEARSFQLIGNVSGEVPFSEGEPGFMAADSLHIEDETVFGPGTVTFSREGMQLSGQDMTWDGTAEELVFARDAVLVFPESEERAGAEVHSPGGLTWELRSADDGRGHGVLLGPVTGTTTDGGTLAADVATVDADARSVTLAGRARVGFPREASLLTLSAEHVTVSENGLGELDLARAEGDVTVVETIGDVETGRLTCAALTGVGDELAAPGPVSFTRQGLSLDGEDLTWNGVTGRLELAARAVVTADQDAVQPPFAGARLEAPGGMVWLLPEGSGDVVRTAHGTLRGPVTGLLADGSRLDADQLLYDGPGSLITLDGHAAVHREIDGVGQDLAADVIQLPFGETAEPTAALCRGDVDVTLTEPDAPAYRLQTDRLDVFADLVRAPGHVVATSGPYRAEGDQLVADRKAGRLDISRNVVFVTDDPERRVLEGAGGLTWWLPDDPELPADQGHGELRGPVTGHTALGERLAAGKLIMDGAARQLDLVDDARIEWDEGGWLEAPGLTVIQAEDGTLAGRSKHLVRWADRGLEGSGRGLHWDRGAGTLRLDRDIRLVDTAPDDTRRRTTLEADGPFTWAAPPGADNPFLAGSGEMLGNVVGASEGLGRFLTDHLVLDGPTGTARLLGPSRLEGEPTLGQGFLTAQESILARRDTAGELVALQARGSVVGHGDDGEQVVDLQTELLEVDRPARTVTVSGTSRIDRTTRGRTTTLTIPEQGQLVLVSDESDELASVRATGRVTAASEDLEAIADEMSWDVSTDHVVLNGDCRFLAIGGWMSAPRVEIWPEAGRFLIPTSTTEFDER